MAVLSCKGKAPGPLGVGEKFPEITIENIQGEKVIFPGMIRAKISLVSIRTTGCRFCVSDFVELQKLYTNYNRDELDVTVINVGVERRIVQEFLEGKDIFFPVFIDQEMESMRKTGSVILPVVYLIAQDRTILFRLTGSFSSEEIMSLLETKRGESS